MDLRTVVTISTLFLMAESLPMINGTDERSNITETKTSTQSCPCPSNSPPAPVTPSIVSNTPAPTLAFLTITWLRSCDGVVMLYHPSNSSTSQLCVCRRGETDVRHIMTDVCRNKKGCEGTPHWSPPDCTQNYKSSGAGQSKGCETLKVKCTEEVRADEGGQLQAYKAVTALLCCVLLILLLIRFTKPTVNALQKRLSDRRQNRWIGPTQSHSVSYHRGKNTVKNNDGEKRLSYPALERLTVSDSREPSSARNSYNF
ncbi:uncharacterized protein V6R79_017978 [Siganus canaliculatus]